MEIRLFGSFEVIVDGRTLPVAGHSERSLLAALACSAGRVVAVERLIDDLWGEDLPANPTNALQVRVSKLRRQLGGRISTRPAGYALEVEADDVDVVRFARLVSGRRFEEALALYRGAPLPEFRDQEWAQAEATRLEELYLAAVEEHVENRLGDGGDVALVSDLEALAAAHPLRERLRGQLMLALHRRGRSADALARYQEGRRLLRDELGLDPSDALQQLEGAILRQEETLHVSAPNFRLPTNLPARLSSFIGRDADLSRALAALGRSRLVTLTGPGGAGKTSLAVETARTAASSYRDGIWFAALAGVVDPAHVPLAIAEALGIADPALAPRELVSAWLSQREVLLVLDNCEHIVDACAGLVEQVLRSAAAGTRIMATSREALGVPGEVQLPVPPLAHAEAMALFVERAAAVNPGFELGPNEGAVSGICQRLDGMPLAIELAAARVNMFPAAEIARGLNDRFRLLTGGPRTAETRHRTLRATIDWSHDLLTEPRRVLLRRLSVFRGGWTLEAAEAVCAGGAAPAGDVLELLTGLVGQSLVVALDGRFRLLETIREYAGDRLVDAGEAEAVRERHARYFVDLAEQTEPELRRPQQAEWLAQLRAEDDNFQLAMHWCRERATDEPDLGLRLAAALGWYWYVGRQTEGRSELAAALDASPGGSSLVRARVLQALSLALRPAGCIVHPSREAAEAARQSLELFAGANDPARAAISQLLLAVEGVAGGDVAGCLEQVVVARGVLAGLGDRWGQALADFVAMEILLRNGADQRALPLAEAAIASFEDLGDDWGRSAVPMHLGAGLRLAGRTEEAVTVLHQALVVCRAAGLENNVARVCAELGGAAADIGHTEEALHWYGECEQVARSLGNDTMLSLASLGYGIVARLRGDPAEAKRRFTDALEVTGRAAMASESVAALTGLAAAQLDSGDLEEASATLSRASGALGGVGEPGVRAGVLEQRARLAVAHGRPAAAAALLAEASSLRDGAVRPRTALESRDVDEVAVTLRPDGSAPDETAERTTGASRGKAARTRQ
ncbi:MAG TPA: BTAD domain-containing putative transcriptional regulator [Acidimicrobiales bacterium]|nr:BTAD domain-containing putative transcriptional regulator [Acidimicrobiales bacterium]